jgi:hypothetical protein
VTWEQLAADAAEEWVPSRIAFGKHQGRSIAEARTDAGWRRWLNGLAQSANARNARMGRWSLRSLEEAAEASLSELRAQHRSAGVFACRSAGVPLASRAAAERAPHFRHRVRSAR